MVAHHEFDGALALLEHVGAPHGLDIEAGEEVPDVGRVGGHVADDHRPDRDERDDDLATLERGGRVDRLQVTLDSDANGRPSPHKTSTGIEGPP